MLCGRHEVYSCTSIPQGRLQIFNIGSCGTCIEKAFERGTSFWTIQKILVAEKRLIHRGQCPIRRPSGLVLDRFCSLCRTPAKMQRFATVLLFAAVALVQVEARGDIKLFDCSKMKSICSAACYYDRELGGDSWMTDGFNYDNSADKESHKSKRRAAIGCKSKNCGSGQSCDEYPFASSYQGGLGVVGGGYPTMRDGFNVCVPQGEQSCECRQDDRRYGCQDLICHFSTRWPAQGLRQRQARRLQLRAPRLQCGRNSQLRYQADTQRTSYLSPCHHAAEPSQGQRAAANRTRLRDTVWRPFRHIWQARHLFARHDCLDCQHDASRRRL